MLLWIVLIFWPGTIFTKGALHDDRLKIIGGQVAAANEFPYAVQVVRADLTSGKYGLCGGSLISNIWVLSAGHCVNSVRFVLVYLGSIYIANGIRYKIQPDGIIIHEKFKDKPLYNDISLISIPYTGYSSSITNIELPFSYQRDSFVGIFATTVGWGFMENDGSPAGTLQYLTLKVEKNEYCKPKSWWYDPETQICLATTMMHSPCRGDSGGPLVITAPNGKIIQIGITSFGTQKNCVKGYPVAYTRLAMYLEWINSKTGIGPISKHPNEI